jgi:4-hydroxybenzoate polyprenyltransferase
MNEGTTPLWKHIARESVLGNRGLTKSVMLLLPWSVLQSLAKDGTGEAGAAGRFFLLLSANICWTLVCILANDLIDRSEDLAAGKRRWIGALPPFLAGAIVLALFGGGWGILATSHAPAGTRLAYLAACVLGLLYSLPPFRAKERGVWGIVFYGLAGTVGYAVLPWTWSGAGPGILAALATAVFLDKWVNIHFHQVIDLDGDAAHGTRTYAVRAGSGRSAGTLRLVSLAAAVWSAGVVVFVSIALDPTWRALVPLAAAMVLAGSAWYSSVSSRKGPEGSALVRELPVWYLGTSYALFRAVPLVLTFRLALALPELWPVFAAALVLVAAESFFVYSYRYE